MLCLLSGKAFFNTFIVRFFSYLRIYVLAFPLKFISIIKDNLSRYVMLCYAMPIAFQLKTVPLHEIAKTRTSHNPLYWHTHALHNIGFGGSILRYSFSRTGTGNLLQVPQLSIMSVCGGVGVGGENWVSGWVSSWVRNLAGEWVCVT
jgi:hypothetical protein